MRVHELLWPQDRIDHIARHNVRPDEVEEVFFGKPFVRRAKYRGEIQFTMSTAKRIQDVICSV